MISRFIALSLIINIALGAITCNNPTSFNPAETVVVPSTNGYRVTLNSAGWVYCDALPVEPNGPTTTWATLLRSSGQSAIGLNAATCTTPLTATANPGLTGSFTGAAPNVCPADFATVYTGTTPAASTTSTTLTASTLAVNNPVSFEIIQPSVLTAANPTGTIVNTLVGIVVTNQNEAPVTPVTVTDAGVPSTSTGSAAQYAISGFEYAFYLQTTGAASVCFQNEGQFASNPGQCGDQLILVGRSPNHAGILSTSACIFVALIAFIFYN